MSVAGFGDLGDALFNFFPAGAEVLQDGFLRMSRGGAREEKGGQSEGGFESHGSGGGRYVGEGGSSHLELGV